jgi:hypothetical protein
MSTKVYGVNAAEGKITFAKPEAKKEKGEKVKDARLGITREQFDKVLAIAQGDGFSADGDTPQGITGQNTRAVQMYVRLAVDRLIAMRTPVATEEVAS